MQNKEINLSLLIEGCMNANPLSQRKLYEMFYGYGMSVALRFAAHKIEAEEIFNDSFIHVFKNIDKFDPSYPFKPWYRRIVINTAIDYHRKYKKFNSTYSTENVPEQHEEVFYFDENEDVLLFIQNLAPAYRMVFTLFVLEDYTHNEIAEKLGISIGTSKSNLSRAKQNLKQIWLKTNGMDGMGNSKKSNSYG